MNLDDEGDGNNYKDKKDEWSDSVKNDVLFTASVMLDIVKLWKK